MLSSHVAVRAGIGNLCIVEQSTLSSARKTGTDAMWSLPPTDSVLHFLSLVAIAAQGIDRKSVV